MELLANGVCVIGYLTCVIPNLIARSAHDSNHPPNRSITSDARWRFSGKCVKVVNAHRPAPTKSRGYTSREAISAGEISPMIFLEEEEEEAEEEEVVVVVVVVVVMLLKSLDNVK